MAAIPRVQARPACAGWVDKEVTPMARFLLDVLAGILAGLVVLAVDWIFFR